MVGRLRAYLAVVSAIGLVVLALLAASVDLGRVRGSLPEGAMLALVVLVAPYLSIPLSRNGRGPSVHVDTPFVFALALAAGAGAAALVMAASGLLYDLAHGKSFSKVAFNNGTHTIGLAAGALAWTTLAGGQVTGSVFVVVKMTLFGVALALDTSVGPLVGLGRFLRHMLLVVVMAQVGVLVLVLAAERPALLLLALGPMLAAYLLLRSESRAVLARQDAEATARREAELRAQEQEVARKLKETDQMKDDLLAMVSHELRTPLTTVVGALRLLSAGPGIDPGERQELLEMADRQARRLRVLIEQLLLAAQSDNGRAGFLSAGSERVDADAAELLAEAATEAQAGGCGDRVRVRCDHGLPVRLAPDPVLQILGNLVDNACKYAPEDSLVWLIGERDGAQAVLAVEDEGGGVPAAQRERIFERFTRLEPGRGLGLGLYIARQLARAQGGDLLATDARATTGARFELRLPLRDPAAPPPQAWSPEEPGWSPGNRGRRTGVGRRLCRCPRWPRRAVPARPAPGPGPGSRPRAPP